MKKDLSEPAQLWEAQGLEPESPKPSVIPIMPFLLSSHLCVARNMATVSLVPQLKASLLPVALGEGL